MSQALTRSSLTGLKDDNRTKLMFEPNAFSFSQSGMKSESFRSKTNLSKLPEAAS